MTMILEKKGSRDVRHIIEVFTVSDAGYFSGGRRDGTYIEGKISDYCFVVVEEE